METIKLSVQHTFKFTATKHAGEIMLSVELQAFYEAHNYQHLDKLCLVELYFEGEDLTTLAEKFIFQLHKKCNEIHPHFVVGPPLLVAIKTELESLENQPNLIKDVVKNVKKLALTKQKSWHKYTFEFKKPESIFLLHAFILGALREKKSKWIRKIERIGEHKFTIETVLNEAELAFLLDEFMRDKKPEQSFSLV